jgi:hypothetical protein
VIGGGFHWQFTVAMQEFGDTITAFCFGVEIMTTIFFSQALNFESPPATNRPW